MSDPKPDYTSVPVDDGWPVARPEEHGLDPALIAAIGPRFEAWMDANMHAILVARDGVLVYERYFTGEDHRWGVGTVGRVAYDASMRHDLRSITKSITSLLVGIAVDRGDIKDIGMSGFFVLPRARRFAHAGERRHYPAASANDVCGTGLERNRALEQS